MNSWPCELRPMASASGNLTNPRVTASVQSSGFLNRSTETVQLGFIPTSTETSHVLPAQRLNACNSKNKMLLLRGARLLHFACTVRVLELQGGKCFILRHSVKALPVLAGMFSLWVQLDVNSPSLFSGNSGTVACEGD